MRQPLPDTARRESREIQNRCRRNPVRTTERSDPRQGCGQACLSAAQKTMRHGNLKIVEEEFNKVQYLTLPGTKQNFQGKTTTVTAQGRSSRTATQPRRKNIRKRKHAKTENMRRKKTCEERKHAKKKTCEPLTSRRVEPRTTRATRRTRQKPPGEISTRAPRRNPAR